MKQSRGHADQRLSNAAASAQVRGQASRATGQAAMSLSGDALQRFVDSSPRILAQRQVVGQGDTSLAGFTAPADNGQVIQRKITAGQQSFVGKAVVGPAGAGRITEVLGPGYTVAFEMGAQFYVPADDLDFAGEASHVGTSNPTGLASASSSSSLSAGESGDEKMDADMQPESEVARSNVNEPFQSYHLGMASDEVLKQAGGQVGLGQDAIAVAGAQWASAAIAGIIAALQAAYPGMPPIELMSDEEMAHEKEELGNASPDAAFHEDLWKVYVDPHYLTIGYSDEAFARLTEFVVHEIRHADQYWRVAQMRVAQDGTDEEIVEGLGIPQPIVAQARLQQLTPDLALDGKAQFEAEAIGRMIPFMTAANDETRCANAWEEMIRMAQEHLDHHAEQAEWLKKMSAAPSGSVASVIGQWKAAETSSLTKASSELALLQENKIDDDDPQAMGINVRMAVLEKIVEFATESRGQIRDYCSGKLSWEQWLATISSKVDEHTKDIDEYEKKIRVATEAYRTDALENDARWVGKTFVSEMRKHW